VRAAALHRGVSRSSARSWTRSVRCCLVVLACLAQLFAAPHRHSPGFAARSIVSDTAATGSGFSLASFDAGKSGVPCAHHASSYDGNGPSPCDHEDCPCCACLCCCSLMHAALGILPQDTARAVFVPLLVTIAAPPAFLGSRARSAAFAGQPRAPPILI
jgi:hypothetical protein